MRLYGIKGISVSPMPLKYNHFSDVEKEQLFNRRFLQLSETGNLGRMESLYFIFQANYEICHGRKGPVSHH